MSMITLEPANSMSHDLAKLGNRTAFNVQLITSQQDQVNDALSSVVEERMATSHHMTQY